MAGGADFDLEILTQRRTGREFVAAAAADLDFRVVGVGICFHGRVSSGARENTGRRAQKQAAPGFDRDPSALPPLSTVAVYKSVENG